MEPLGLRPSGAINLLSLPQMDAALSQKDDRPLFTQVNIFPVLIEKECCWNISRRGLLKKYVGVKPEHFRTIITSNYRKMPKNKGIFSPEMLLNFFAFCHAQQQLSTLWNWTSNFSLDILFSSVILYVFSPTQQSLPTWLSKSTE